MIGHAHVVIESSIGAIGERDGHVRNAIERGRMKLKDETVIVWMAEKEKKDILGLLRRESIKHYVASFPDLFETAIFVGGEILDIEEFEDD